MRGPVAGPEVVNFSITMLHFLLIKFWEAFIVYNKIVVNFVLVKTPTVVTSCGTIRAIMKNGTGYIPSSF